MSYGNIISEHDILAAYDEHSDAVFRHCHIRIADRDASKELMSECFRRLWLFAARGNQVDSVKIFLYREINNLIAEKKKEKDANDVLPAFFSTVSPQDRVIYVLHHIDGFSSSEIVQIIGGSAEKHGETLRALTTSFSAASHV